MYWMCTSFNAKNVGNLRITRTEPLEQMFETTCNWRMELADNKFIIYANILEIIMKRVIQNGINTATSRKDYINGFAAVVKKFTAKTEERKTHREYKQFLNIRGLHTANLSR